MVNSKKNMEFDRINIFLALSRLQSNHAIDPSSLFVSNPNAISCMTKNMPHQTNVDKYDRVK